MAIDKSKKKATKQEKAVNHEIKVTRAHEFKSGDIGFDAVVNGIKLYNMTYIDTGDNRKNEEPFISFPCIKSSKNDKYYNQYFFKVTDDDMAAIEKGIEEVL